MKYFEKKIGSNGAYAKYYLQEPNEEIDSHRLYPTIVICPGGAYLWTSYREDEPIALRFLAEGFHVIVVHYATEGLAFYANMKQAQYKKNPVSLFPNSLVELAKAISYLREHAETYAVNVDDITVGGFSAGGHLASLLGVYWHEKWLEKLVGKPKEIYRPNKLLLAYPAIDLTPQVQEDSPSAVLLAVTGSVEPNLEKLNQLNSIIHVSEKTPPTFLWHTNEDELVPAGNTMKFGAKLMEYGVPVEIHLFTKGKHGLGLGNFASGRKQDQTNAQVAKWIDLFLEWARPIKTTVGSFYKGIEE